MSDLRAVAADKLTKKQAEAELAALAEDDVEGDVVDAGILAADRRGEVAQTGGVATHLRGLHGSGASAIDDAMA